MGLYSAGGFLCTQTLSHGRQVHNFSWSDRGKDWGAFELSGAHDEQLLEG